MKCIRLLLIVSGLFFAASIEAQPVDTLLFRGKNLLGEALNEKTTDKILNARALFERATEDNVRASLAHYYVAYSELRLANLLMPENESQQVTDDILAHLDRAIEHLRISINQNEKWAESHALLSNVYGQKIGLKPIAGMLLGPKSSRALKKAKKLDPDNPRVILTEAINTFNTPKMWGGSKEKGMEGFKHAATLFQQEVISDLLQPSWGHTETYTWMGIAYMQQDQYVQAREAFEKALEITPNYGWVQYSLFCRL